MAMQDTDFWRKMGENAPGMFDLGANIYTRNQGQKEASQRLRTAQGPLYDASMQAAQQQLERGGSFDPRAAGAERFKAEQGLLAGADAKNLDELMQKLHGTGTTGLATFSGQQGGPAVNPNVAAFYKAKADRDAQLAVSSLDRGEAQLDRYLNRSGMLQGQAAGVQQTGIAADNRRPSKTAAGANIIKGVGSIMKNKDALQGIGGMLGKGWDLLGQGKDWIGNQTGWWDVNAFAPDYDDYRWDMT